MLAAREIEPAALPNRFRVRTAGRLRELWYFKRNLENYCDAGLDAFREFGDVIRVTWPKKYITFFHPRHVKHVLRTGVLNYPKSRDYAFLKPILGNGLFVSDGDLWTRQRKILAPEFRPEPVRRFLPGMVDNIEQMFSLWEQGDAPRVVSDDFLNLTLCIVGGALFHEGFREEAEIIGRSLETVLSQATFQMLTAGLLRSWMPTPGNLRARRAERRLNAVVRDVVARGRASGTIGKHDVLSRLVAFRDEHSGAAMPEQQIVDEVKSLILAGHETTSLALSWTFYMLAQHPEVEERLHRESAAVLGKRGATVEAVPELEYARRVFLETMRLYPPVPGLSRDVREEEEIDGIRVYPDEMVSISPYVTQRHPACWDHPEAFDPDRFAPERADQIVPYSYMPFLLGRRACLGEHFGMLEGTLAVAMIAARYKLELATPPPIATRPIATLRLAKPLRMRIRRR